MKLQRLAGILDGGLDGGSADPGLLRRIRVVGATSLVMAGFGVPYVLLNAVYVSPALGLQIALCLGAAMVNLWVLHRTLDTVACGHIGTAILFTAIVSLCLQSGGFDTPSASWLYLIPLTAAVLINARAGLVWCGICALTTTVFWGSDWLGLPVLNRIDEEVRHGYYLLSRLSALGALSALAAVFALMQRRLEDTLVESHRQIETLAYSDSLTGLPNRDSFQQRLEQALRLAERYDRTGALLFVDLDGFKDVNDSLGHGAGDDLLREVAARFARSLRLSDAVSRVERRAAGDLDASSISRLGGDEFTVLLAEISGAEGAAVVARRMLEALAAPIQLGEHEVFVSASIGVALFPQHGQDAETLLGCADQAMYDAKSRGRNQFQFFSAEHGDALMRRISIEARLRRALEVAGRGEASGLRLDFQPIRHLRQGDTRGAEALLRWDDAELGTVEPGAFIPVAEKTGLIRELGSWVFRAAVAQIADWQARGFDPLRVGVNISAHQVRYHALTEEVAAALASAGVSPDCLELEITESTLMHDDEITRSTLESLHELGVSLALDDFGTGYSSLSYLKRYPIDRVKIDRSFVMDLPRDGDDAAIVSAILAMARSLRVGVVAEGVETEAQLAFLAEHGCEEVQGYLLGRPCRPEAFERFMSRTKTGSAGEER